MKLIIEQHGRLSKQGTKPIVIRVYHNGKNAYIDTGLAIEPKFFNKKSMRVSMPDEKKAFDINAKLSDLMSKYSKTASLLSGIADSFDILTLRNTLVNYVDKEDIVTETNEDFFGLGVQLVAELRLDNRRGHADNIHTTLSILKEFSEKNILPFHVITPEYLKKFHRWYVPEHGKQVTFNKHLRHIKLLFNEARRRRIIGRDTYPFDYYQIPSDYDAEIRCLTSKQIFKISQFEGLGRDMFLLSYYLCGLNMVDMLSLPTGGNYIEHERIKTRRSPARVKLRLKLQPEAKEIIARYPDPSGKNLIYLDYTTRYTALQMINEELAKIANQLKMPKFTHTYARHSWATNAGKLNVPDAIIDRGLMHTPRGMIEKYRQFNYSKVDKANRAVIDDVFKSVKQTVLASPKES